MFEDIEILKNSVALLINKASRKIETLKKILLIKWILMTIELLKL